MAEQMVAGWVIAAALGALAPAGMLQDNASSPGPSAPAPTVRPAPTPTPSPTPTPAITPLPPITPAPADEEGNGPIVPEQTFETAVPPLSSDINAPLEPMPAAPPATSAQTQSPAVTATPAPLPSLAGQPQTLPTTLPPPAAEDQALEQPLTPLATFNAEPLNQVADKAASGDTVVIRYDTVVNGLDPVDLTSEFKSLSALEQGDGKAANATMVQARARQDEDLAVRLLKSRGYYDGSATSLIEQVTGEQSRVRAIITAEAGPLYKFGSIKIDAPATVPPGLIDQALPLKVGDPIDAARVEAAEANVSLKLPQEGYPFVKVGQRDILLDGQTHLGDYTLPVAPGARSSFGTYTTTGKLAFSAEHVGVLARFQQGELYDVRKVDDLRKALVATGLFSTVSVEPVPTDRPGPDGTEQVDLLVRQEAGPPRTLAGSAGYGTGQGILLQGTFTHRNLFPPEGALILGAIAGTQEQGLNATFRRSNAGRRDRAVQLTASVDHSNYDAFDAQTITLSGRISYDSTPIWQKPLTYSYGVDLLGTNESVYSFADGKRIRGKYLIAALPGQVLFDQSDDLLNPTRGYRLKLNLSPETSVRGSVSPYVRTMVEGTFYYPATDSLVIAGRARAGVIAGIERDDLAPSRRYYGGGGGSVRGYGYQELGPRDPNGDPLGGRSLNEFSLEARYRFGNFGIVPFLDAGQAYESVFPKGSDLRYGAGIGGRFYTNFGPFRIDVATPLNPRKGDPKIALYISIGQAF